MHPDVAVVAAMPLDEQFELFRSMPRGERMRLEAEVLAFEESEDRGEPVSVDDLWGEREFRSAWAISVEGDTPLAFNYHRILKDGIEDTRGWALVVLPERRRRRRPQFVRAMPCLRLAAPRTIRPRARQRRRLRRRARAPSRSTGSDEPDLAVVARAAL